MLSSVRTESVSRHFARLCAGQTYAMSCLHQCNGRGKHSYAVSIAFGPYRNIGSGLGGVAYLKEVSCHTGLKRNTMEEKGHVQSHVIRGDLSCACLPQFERTGASGFHCISGFHEVPVRMKVNRHRL
jgi:hypothetical protein